MPFLSWGSSSKKKKKERKSERSSSKPPASMKYGYPASVSTITLHRPIPGPILSQTYQQEPANRPWESNPTNPYGQNMQMAVSQPYLPIRPPPQNQVYGQPQNYGAPWASSANLSNSGQKLKSKISKSTLHLPSSVSGQLHAATKSVTNLSESWNQMSAQYLDQGAAFCDRISSKFDNVISCMDQEQFSGDERDLMIFSPQAQQQQPIYADSSRNTSQALSIPSSSSTNYFSKVWDYQNARLPPYLPPLKLYIPTYPLLCLAAQYSLRVYNKPTNREREDHFKASILHGTKAMVLKSLPIDDMNTIVFAIRGSQTFMDWAVNVRQAPTSPKGFLDDRGNLCHAGFLCVAKFMVPQVAARLKTLLQEDPTRSTASLLITGHSAGGAVAQLLYAHMMSETVESELTYLTGFFKRVHCVTFGAPPVSLLPLEKPERKRSRKSLFFAFVNEGDPVVRADPAIVRSLLRLYATPSPQHPCPIVSSVLKPSKKLPKPGKLPSWPATPTSHIWKVPASALSLGGRIALLRERFGGRGGDDIEVCQVTDEMLREVVYGDPLCHTMLLYSKRIEILATRAATAGAFG